VNPRPPDLLICHPKKKSCERPWAEFNLWKTNYGDISPVGCDEQTRVLLGRRGGWAARERIDRHPHMPLCRCHCKRIVAKRLPSLWALSLYGHLSLFLPTRYLLSCICVILRYPLAKPRGTRGGGLLGRIDPPICCLDCLWDLYKTNEMWINLLKE